MATFIDTKHMSNIQLEENFANETCFQITWTKINNKNKQHVILINEQKL